MAADLRRYLEGHAIQARAPSALYLTRKFVARNKLAVAAAAAVLLALVAGLLIAYTGYLAADARRVEAEEARRAESAQRRIAEQHEALARREAARANAVLALVRRMFSSVATEETGDSDYTLRQLLDDFDLELASGAALDPEVEASVRTTMARAYETIGMLDKFRGHLERARDLERVVPLDPTATLELRMGWLALLHDEGDYAGAEALCAELLAQPVSNSGMLASLRQQHGDLLQHLGRLEESEASFRAQLETLPPDAEKLIPVLVRDGLAKVLAHRGERQEAERLQREALDLCLATYGEESAIVAHELYGLAITVRDSGRHEEAEVLQRCAVEIYRRVFDPDHPELARALNSLGRTLFDRGALQDSEQVLREGLEIARRKLGPDHPSVAVDASVLALNLERQRRYAESEELHRECLRIRLCNFDERSVEVARAMANLGTILSLRGQNQEAETWLLGAIEIRREIGEEYGLSSTLPRLARVYSKLGRSSEAIALQQEAIELLMRVPGTNEQDLAAAVLTLAAFQGNAGEFAEAIRLARQSLEIRLRLYGEEHINTAKCRSDLGGWLQRAGQWDEAERELRSALATQRRIFGDSQVEVAQTAVALGGTLAALKREAEAIEWFRFALPTLLKYFGRQHSETREAADALIELLELSGQHDAAEVERAAYKGA